MCVVPKYRNINFVRWCVIFAEDLSATQIALKTAINRNTVNRYLNEIRERIVEFSEQYAPLLKRWQKSVNCFLTLFRMKIMNLRK